MNKKGLNNKGFSLVELIIVIAIMAVLVGALAPQYIKYLDKSKLASDTQVADSVRQAIEITLMDPAVAAPSYTVDKYTDLPDDTATLEAFWKEVYAVLGVTNGAGIEGQLQLNKDVADMEFKIDANKNVSVRVIGGDYGDDADCKLEVK